MAKVLQIENFAASTIINLANDASLCAYFGEAGNRPLTIGGNVTRVFRFRATSTTKALARANVNAFILGLRKAMRWGEDDSIAESWFLREAADGETPVRSLILGFEASAVSEGSAIDAYQTMNTALYVDVALTLQNHREEDQKKTLDVSDETSDVAIGKKLQLYGATNTAESRLFLNLTSTITGTGVHLTKVWIGMMNYVGDNFQHIWRFDNATTLYALADTTETTSAGSFGTNIVKTTFASVSDMRTRVQFVIGSVYAAVDPGYDSSEAKGKFLVLLRYKVDSGTGTVLVRGGVASSSIDDMAYNEAVLVDDDGSYHFASLGVMSFPPYGMRQETVTTNMVPNVAVNIQAQRLSGNATIVFDTLTFIPYKHFAKIESAQINSTQTLRLVINETLDPFVFNFVTSSGLFVSKAKIVHQNNFLYPVGFYDSSDFRVQMVYAAEREDSQIHGDNLDSGKPEIYEAYEAYNG